MINQSLNDKTWRDGDLIFTEVIKQAYTDCCFSAGFVKGHPVNTVYLMIDRGGKTDVLLTLRPDELAAIAWIATGVLWSQAVISIDKP